MQEEAEPVGNLSNILNSDKDIKSKSGKSLHFMESSIHFQDTMTSNVFYNNNNRIFEEDEDIKDIFFEMSKGKKEQPKAKRWFLIALF